MSSDYDLMNANRNLYSRNAAGKGLFAGVRVSQQTCTKDLAAWSEDLPTIGIMIPALICMTHTDLEAIDLFPGPCGFHRNHVRLTGPGCSG